MKRYIKPNTDIVKIETTSLLDTVSNGQFGGGSGGTGDAGITDAGARDYDSDGDLWED